MKRIVTILLALTMLFSLAACGQKDNTDGGKTPDTSTTQKPDENKTVTATPAEIEAKIAAAIGEDNYQCTVDKEKDSLSGYYGLDMSKVESYCAKESTIPSVYN